MSWMIYGANGYTGELTARTRLVVHGTGEINVKVDAAYQSVSRDASDQDLGGAAR